MKSNVSFNSSLSKFGIGLFETIRVEEEAIDLDLHLKRLFNSIRELKLNIEYDIEFLKDKILKYIRNNEVCNKAIRITVFDEGYNISTRDIPYNNEIYKNGIKLNISSIRRGNSILYRHKTTNYFENIYTKNTAVENGFDDGIFLDTNDVILECSMSNIFFIKGKTVFTPHKDLPILNGTIRKRVSDICGELNIELVETEIKISEIEDFEFSFVTNSLMKAIKVTKIEGVPYKKNNELFDIILSYL